MSVNKLFINILNNTGDRTQPFLQPECIEPLSHISIQFNCTFILRINSFDIEGGKIGILLYADDIVLIAENENDL
jgi:hypothetical protein